MKKGRYILITVSVILSLNSCKFSPGHPAGIKETANYEKLEKASWLIGRWENNSPDANFSEVWERTCDSVFSGYSHVVIGKDTVSSEAILLEQRGDSLFYIPTVSDQNNGQAIQFILTNQTDNQLVFENPSHDFPQKITYARITPDSLVAEISGQIKGQPQSRKFPMKKKKDAH